MKLLSDQIDEASFLLLGREAVSLLERRDFQLLADRFGYALKCGRSPLDAIEGDFQSCLAKFRASSDQSAAVSASMVVKYYKPNSSNLFALVECVFTTKEGCPILAEMIITSSGGGKYVMLEQLSLATA